MLHLKPSAKRGVGRSGGFTLVEMLVVIAILAVLASLLLPSLQQALVRARTIKCASQQRQLGVAIQLFVGDNAGHLPQWRSPSPPAGNGSTPYVVNALAPYLGTLSTLFYCPAARVHYPRLGDYGFNVLYHCCGDGTNGWGLKLSQVEDPSSVFQVVDATDSLGNGYWVAYVLGNNAIQNGVPPLPPRHGLGMNWGFFDLHQQWISVETFSGYSAAQRNQLIGYPAPP